MARTSLQVPHAVFSDTAPPIESAASLWLRVPPVRRCACAAVEELAADAHVTLLLARERQRVEQFEAARASPEERLNAIANLHEMLTQQLGPPDLERA